MNSMEKSTKIKLLQSQQEQDGETKKLKIYRNENKLKMLLIKLRKLLIELIKKNKIKRMN